MTDNELANKIIDEVSDHFKDYTVMGIYRERSSVFASIQEKYPCQLPIPTDQEIYPELLIKLTDKSSNEWCIVKFTYSWGDPTAKYFIEKLDECLEKK